MNLFLALTIALLSDPGPRPTRETFEGPEPSWRLAESDCGAALTRQRRSFVKPHGGQSCEELQLRTGRGSYAYLTHEIEPARVIPELAPRLWYRSNHGGAQLLARVVLPRSENPRDGRPLTILIRGNSYEEIGAWRQLAIEDAALQVRRQEAVLRRRFGPKVDVREAYLDLIVINAYDGPGSQEIWIDDLEVAGHVASPAERDLVPAQPAAYQDPEQAAGAAPRDDERVQLHGSVLSVAGRPLLIRAIEHRGESFDGLQQLGFNTVSLAAPATEPQLSEARRLGLWLVCPPPHFNGREPFGPEYDRVLAWEFGRGLSRQELEQRRRLADEVRQSDGAFKRPLVCSAVSQLAAYSRLADVLLCDKSPLGSSLEMVDYAPWLRDQARLMRPGTPFWATVQTEPAPQVYEQLAALGFGQPPVMTVEPEQMRLLALHAVAAGARGLWFASRTRLDANTPAAQRRTAALRLLNRELAIVEPWAAGGAFDRTLETNDPLAQVSVLQTERSRLLMILRHSPGQQFVAGPAGKEQVSFVDPGASSSPQAYQVGPAGIVPIRNRRRDSGGLRLTLDDVPLSALAVLTQDPLVINHLARQPAAPRGTLGRLHYETAKRNLAAVEEVDKYLAQQGHPLATAAALLADARANLKQSERLVAAEDDQAAQLFAGRAQRSLAQVRRSHWEQAVAGFPSPVASPYCLQFETLAGHWHFAGRLKTARWSGNALTGGRMESLDEMREAGWKYERHAETSLQTNVDLAPAALRSGSFGLRVQAAAADERTAPGVVEVPPIRITTSPVTVQAGQIVRINGWAKLPAPLAGTHDGLLIFDSLGGEQLAQRIVKSGPWQEFTFYRAAPRPGELTLTFALTGLGQAWLDDVTIMLLENTVAAPAR